MDIWKNNIWCRWIMCTAIKAIKMAIKHTLKACWTNNTEKKRKMMKKYWFLLCRSCVMWSELKRMTPPVYEKLCLFRDIWNELKNRTCNVTYMKVQQRISAQDDAKNNVLYHIMRCYLFCLRNTLRTNGISLNDKDFS